MRASGSTLAKMLRFRSDDVDLEQVRLRVEEAAQRIVEHLQSRNASSSDTVGGAALAKLLQRPSGLVANSQSTEPWLHASVHDLINMRRAALLRHRAASSKE